MKYVVDANIILSGLISDSMTRRFLVELKDDLLTPAYVHDEIGKYTQMVSEKSGLSPAEVEELIEMLFKRIHAVPRPVVLESLQEAARIMRDTDPDDAVYLAAALERDAQIWSDDRDYEEQDAVPVATTGDIVERVRDLEAERAGYEERFDATDPEDISAFDVDHGAVHDRMAAVSDWQATDREIRLYEFAQQLARNCGHIVSV